MTDAQLSLSDVVGRAYARAVPAKKFVRIVQSWVEQQGGGRPDGEHELSAAILRRLLVPSPPALLLGYLAQVLSAPLLTARVVALQLLEQLSSSHTNGAGLASICSVILTNPTGLAETDALPSTLDGPSQDVPDVGTSASANPFPSSSTLALMLPLIRLCANLVDPAPFPILAFTNRLLSLLQPYPAPPLDVGLEASALLPTLPDALSTPLRNCLSGLMADVALSQDAAQLQISDLVGLGALQDGVGLGPAITETGGAEGTIPSLPGVFRLSRQPLPIPLPRALDFLLAHAHRSARFTKSTYPQAQPPAPWENHLHILRAGRYFELDPEAFLLQLVESGLQACLESYQNIGAHFVKMFLFLVDGLPTLLRSWMDAEDSDWAYPDNLPAVLTTVFSNATVALSAYNTFMNEAYAAKVSEAEADDESGGPMSFEGWRITQVQETLVVRLLDLGLLSSEEAGTALPGIALPIAATGESLANRLASAPTAHIPALVQIITTSRGAQRAFATEVMNVILACPQTTPPENLFNTLSAQPALLATLLAVISPASLLDVLVTKLLNPPDDAAGCADDPQGSLTRFGEGVVLVEAVVALFDLPLPLLLKRARRAIGLRDLTPTQQTCMSGWAKALFGADGIDDQILLSTPPADLCCLTSSLIQQSITATASGAIDQDTLHSGLSYFSQPLLSWSLGGIVAWLCQEIERQGLVSALHLDVLQNLVLGDSFPEPLLRVNAGVIAGLLDPASNLQAVFASSGFDANGVRARLEALGITCVPGAAKPPPLASNTLRSDLQLVRSLDIAQSTWANSLLSTLEECLVSAGPDKTLEVIVGEIIQPSLLDFDRTNGDPLASFAPVMLSLRHTPTILTSLVARLVNQLVPTFFDCKVKPTSNSAFALASLLKASIVLAVELQPAAKSADILVEHLIDELRYQKSRSTSANGPARKKFRSLRSLKRSNAGETVLPLSLAATGALRVMCGALGGDEELRARWPAFGSLVES